MLTVEDFGESLKLVDDTPPQPQNHHPISSTLAKQLASINSHMEKFDKLIVRGATIMPELPTGKNLTIRIYENWGDRQYVGLNGVEFFNENGEKLLPKRLYC